jgi:hypothetical protein
MNREQLLLTKLETILGPATRTRIHGKTFLTHGSLISIRTADASAVCQANRRCHWTTGLDRSWLQERAAAATELRRPFDIALATFDTIAARLTVWVIPGNKLNLAGTRELYIRENEDGRHILLGEKDAPAIENDITRYAFSFDLTEDELAALTPAA